MRVSDLCTDAPDPAGNRVSWIYSKNPPDYGVYRAGSRVMVLFADDADRAKTQSVALSPLNDARDEIAGLANDWRGDPKAVAKVDGFDERVAGALTVALQGDLVNAKAALDRVRSDIAAERGSIAKFEYIMVAAVCAFAILSISWVGLTHQFVKTLYPTLEEPDALWAAIGGGTLGAIFSVATGISSRTLLPGLRFRDNATDASLRIIIGAIGAAVMLSLQRSGLVTGLLMGSGTTPYAVGPETTIFVIGFLAGFSERLVPDLLSRVGVDTTPGPDERAAVSSAHAASDAAAQLSTPLSKSPDGAAQANDVEDASPCDASPAPGEAETLDADLPRAEGGVAGANPAGTPATGDDGDACLCDAAPTDTEASTSDADLPAAQGGVAQ